MAYSTSACRPTTKRTGHVEWNTLINIWRAGAKHESARGATGMNYTYFLQDPFTGFIRHVQCSFGPPNGTNWGYYCDPEMDKLLDQVRNTFSEAEQTKLLQKIHRGPGGVIIRPYHPYTKASELPVADGKVDEV